MDRPTRLDCETVLLRIVPPALLALAIGFAAAQLAALVLAPALAAGGFVAAYQLLSRDPPRDLAFAAFDPLPLAFPPAAQATDDKGSGGELLLDDELPALPADSNVIRLFPGRPARTQVSAVGDAFGALTNALAELRCSLRKAGE